MPARIHVVAPTGRDSEVIVTVLQDAGIDAMADSVASLPALGSDPAVGAVMISDEALAHIDFPALTRSFDAQPTWSDCPIILLTRKGSSVPQQTLARLENVTILERPLHRDGLVSAARAALRARLRQWKARDYLLEREAAERQIKELAATLEQRVAERTQELTDAMARQIAADEQRRASEEHYRTTIELSGLIPWTADSNGQIETAGERWYAITGATVEQTLGAGWQSFIHPDDVAETLRKWADTLDSQTRADFEYRLRQSDGGYRKSRVQGAPLLDPVTKIVRWYGTLEDVDERRSAEEQLRQLQSEMIHVSRLSAMGAMAGTLAHELNQPLAAISNYVRGAQRLLDDATPDQIHLVKEALGEAEAGTTRAGQVVRRLRELVARGIVHREAENLAALVQEAARIALVDAHMLGIACTFEIDEAIVVLADRIQLQQVVINLLRNAVDAIQGTPDRRIAMTADIQDDGFCAVTVHDSGPGVAPEFLDQLFTPFATTKRDGVGIGLSISQTIIEANGGQLSLQPSRLGGAAMCFTVPLAD